MTAISVQLMATGGGVAGVGKAAKWVLVSATVLLMLAVGGALAFGKAMGYQTLIVRSGSMTGTADVGSLVVARSIAAEDVKVGDVILLKRPADGHSLPPVLHRVIERNIDDYGEIVIRTKGDANATPDPNPVVLRGKTVTPVAIVPHLGLALAATQTRLGWFGLVILPFVVAIGLAIRRVWATETEDRELI